mmetsp:Transcript_58155/g.180686  ORF Transcript_58155/g.180686 Transcript_58155/m.180686 type:complete len:263 (+) Transcript_58155:66-854(+)
MESHEREPSPADADRRCAEALRARRPLAWAHRRRKARRKWWSGAGSALVATLWTCAASLTMLSVRSASAWLPRLHGLRGCGRPMRGRLPRQRWRMRRARAGQSCREAAAAEPPPRQGDRCFRSGVARRRWPTVRAEPAAGGGAAAPCTKKRTQERSSGRATGASYVQRPTLTQGCRLSSTSGCSPWRRRRTSSGCARSSGACAWPCGSSRSSWRSRRTRWQWRRGRWTRYWEASWRPLVRRQGSRCSSLAWLLTSAHGAWLP